MVNVVKRMRRMHTRVIPPTFQSESIPSHLVHSQLLDVRLGPGAVLMSNKVKKIHMTFAKKYNNGHLGPRKFWHHYLPRLKYHNPAVPMTINVTTDQSTPALMTIFFGQPLDPNAPSPAPTDSTTMQTHPSDQSPSEESRTIDMQHRKPEDILKDVIKFTQGVQVEPAASEEEQIQDLEERRRRSETDKQRVAQVLANKKRQEEILRQARQSVEPT